MLALKLDYLLLVYYLGWGREDASSSSPWFRPLTVSYRGSCGVRVAR